MELLTATLKTITPLNESLLAEGQRHLDQLTKPQGSLGRLEELAAQAYAISGGRFRPLERMAITVFAADHGVVEEGVSLYPREVTAQMVLNFLAGGAGINVMARHLGAEVVVIDIGVDHDFAGTPGLVARKVLRGTRNMARQPAMTREQAIAALEVGIAVVNELAARGVQAIGTGDMGIGNTTASSAVLAAMAGLSVEEVTGRGTGISDAMLAHKVRVIERALACTQPDPRDPVDVLAKVGGLEIAGIAGAMLAGAAARLPVVVDGFISTAAALLAVALAPACRAYLIAAHRSAERGHAVMLEKLGLQPLLDLDMRLGEGTGATLALGLLRVALRLACEMATFGEANVATALDG